MTLRGGFKLTEEVGTGRETHAFMVLTKRTPSSLYMVITMELSFIRSKGVAGGHKVVWITGSSGVPHLGHLLDVLLALGNDAGRNDDIEDEVALYEGEEKKRRRM